MAELHEQIKNAIDFGTPKPIAFFICSCNSAILFFAKIGRAHV